jgi:hypothetical protein
MNTTIICPRTAKKPVEISDAIQHQIEDELLRAKSRADRNRSAREYDDAMLKQSSSKPFRTPLTEAQQAARASHSTKVRQVFKA